MDWLDLTLVVTKGLGIVFGAAFAVLGLLVDFRDKNTSRVTKWGNVALIGIVVSCCVSLVSQGAESLKARDEADAQAKRTNALLAQIERSISPLNGIKINYQFDVPLDDPILADYRRRFLEGIDQIASSKPGSESPLGYASRGPGGVESILIPWNSPLMPTDHEVAASALFRHSAVVLIFFKTPIDYDTFRRVSDFGAQGPKPSIDLSLVAKNENNPAASTGSISDQLLYDFRNKVLQVSTRQLEPDPTVSFNRSRIVSVADLCGSQLWVVLDNTSRDYPTEQLWRATHLKFLSIEVGARPMIIRDFKTYESLQGRLYMFIFPKTEDDLDKLTP